MAVWLDIIGSFVIGALLALNVMSMNADITAYSHKNTLTYAAQVNALTIAEIFDYDLRKAGYGVDSTAITAADTAQIQFLAYNDSSGVADTLNYYATSPDSAANTPNPNDRRLYRVLNSTSQMIGTGVTTFQLSYFNAVGDSLTLPVTLDDIRQIRLDLTVESTSPYDTTYVQVFMQLRIRPKNLGS